jgi:tellurite resistance protein TehA-like permease
VAWFVVPQFLLALLAFSVVRLVLLSARYWPPENLLLRRIVPVMGNMLGLPQIILALAMLDIFLYNAYQIRLIPLWVSAVIVMVLGLAILGVFFFRTIREARRQRAKIRQEKEQ